MENFLKKSLFEFSFLVDEMFVHSMFDHPLSSIINPIHRVVLLALNLIHHMDKTVRHSEMRTGQPSRVQTYSTSEPPPILFLSGSNNLIRVGV